MLLMYKGEGRNVSFIPNSVYEAVRVDDGTFKGYAIFDEGDDWYFYGENFVEKNFEEMAEKDEVENIRRAV